MQERQRLARDLHDAVTQTLFSASLIAEALPSIWASDQEAGTQLLEEIRHLCRGALAEMRTLLLELRPATLTEASLGNLLRQLGEAVTGRTGVPVTFEIEDQCITPVSVHVALYRIAQEALNNVVKHASAAQISICLRCTAPHSGQPAEAVRLEINDDGCGFDLANTSPDHLGLGIMRERAQATGVELEIDSAPGQGTQVIATWQEDGRPSGPAAAADKSKADDRE
jgi:signal transduction histidine kinase